jgi:hypothetical protein
MWLKPRRQSWLFIPPVPIVLVVLVVATTGTEDTAAVSVEVQFVCWAMLKEKRFFDDYQQSSLEITPLEPPIPRHAQKNKRRCIVFSHRHMFRTIADPSHGTEFREK